MGGDSQWFLLSDTAEHYISNRGYVVLTKPLFSYVFVAAFLSATLRSNVIIPILQRRKLSLGELKSFVPGLLALEWH